MAKLGACELLGIHVNLPGVVPPEISEAVALGTAPPANLLAEERDAFDQLKIQFTKWRAYALIMGTRSKPSRSRVEALRLKNLFYFSLLEQVVKSRGRTSCWTLCWTFY